LRPGAGVLATADAVLDPGAAVMTQFQDGDVLAGMGSLAATDQPRTLRPRRRGREIELRHPGAVSIGAITVDRLQPRRFGHFEDRCADRVVEPIADRETDPPASRQSAVNACV